MLVHSFAFLFRGAPDKMNYTPLVKQGRNCRQARGTH